MLVLGIGNGDGDFAILNEEGAFLQMMGYSKTCLVRSWRFGQFEESASLQIVTIEEHEKSNLNG